MFPIPEMETIKRKKQNLLYDLIFFSHQEYT